MRYNIDFDFLNQNLAELIGNRWQRKVALAAGGHR
jgi:hypothetical protein